MYGVNAAFKNITFNISVLKIYIKKIIKLHNNRAVTHGVLSCMYWCLNAGTHVISKAGEIPQICYRL